VRRDSKTEALSAVPLFSDCSKKELSAIARLCTSIDVPAGDVLTKEGASGREFFVISSGQAKVVIGKRTVATLGPGDSIGEMALLDGGPRTATVTATTPLEVYALGVREFRSLLDASPSITRKILVSVAGRLRAAESRRPH
jgi:CRP/FNR family transcriptional regulator, cyclic AMP receptor protein